MYTQPAADSGWIVDFMQVAGGGALVLTCWRRSLALRGESWFPPPSTKGASPGWAQFQAHAQPHDGLRIPLMCSMPDPTWSSTGMRSAPSCWQIHVHVQPHLDTSLKFLRQAQAMRRQSSSLCGVIWAMRCLSASSSTSAQGSMLEVRTSYQ